MDNIFTRTLNMPAYIRAIVVPDINSDYNLYVNDHLSETAVYHAVQHELRHIENNDFTNLDPIRLVEARADME